jgi:catechol 2,3-dioxygenase-like lactoylglutathione lyase family enzyme
MEVDLFAGLPVSDYERALEWYPRLLGDLETFDPHDTERVWTLAEHRYVYVVLHRERAGRALVTLFVDDLDGFVAAAASRGVEPSKRETYDNGVRKVTYLDPDGNEIGVGGGPA